MPQRSHQAAQTGERQRLVSPRGAAAAAPRAVAGAETQSRKSCKTRATQAIVNKSNQEVQTSKTRSIQTSKLETQTDTEDLYTLGQIQLQLATIREKLEKANKDNPERKHYIDIDTEECTPTKLKLEVFYEPESNDHPWTQEDIEELARFERTYHMAQTEGAM